MVSKIDSPKTPGLLHHFKCPSPHHSLTSNTRFADLIHHPKICTNTQTLTHFCVFVYMYMCIHTRCLNHNKILAKSKPFYFSYTWAGDTRRECSSSPFHLHKIHTVTTPLSIIFFFNFIITNQFHDIHSLPLVSSTIFIKSIHQIKSCNSSSTTTTDISAIMQDCSLLRILWHIVLSHSLDMRAAHVCVEKALSFGIPNMWTSNLPSWGLSLSNV